VKWASVRYQARSFAAPSFILINDHLYLVLRLSSTLPSIFYYLRNASEVGVYFCYILSVLERKVE
jgi:hypothetical protein